MTPGKSTASIVPHSSTHGSRIAKTVRNTEPSKADRWHTNIGSGIHKPATRTGQEQPSRSSAVEPLHRKRIAEKCGPDIPDENLITIGKLGLCERQLLEVLESAQWAHRRAQESY